MQKVLATNLNNVSQINSQGTWLELDRHPNTIFLDLKALHAIDLKEDGDAAAVGVRRQPDNLVRLRARWVVVHPHRLHPVFKHLFNIFLVDLQRLRDQSQQRFGEFLQFRYERL